VRKGELIIDEYKKLLSPKTKLVAVNHASNALGTINPVREIIDEAHKVGAVALIDGAQSTVHLDIDVQEMDCDFFVFSSHKMYGPNRRGCIVWKKRTVGINATVPGWGRDDQGGHI
jgi:cysteine desulfurase/selenocysteine lyase